MVAENFERKVSLEKLDLSIQSLDELESLKKDKVTLTAKSLELRKSFKKKFDPELGFSASRVVGQADRGE